MSDKIVRTVRFRHLRPKRRITTSNFGMRPMQERAWTRSGGRAIPVLSSRHPHRGQEPCA